MATSSPAISSGDLTDLVVSSGSTTVFPLVQPIAGASVPIYGSSGVSTVYLAGVAQGGGWMASLGYGAAITFATAPAAGVAVTADFGALWLCRFADDIQDLEEFLNDPNLWTPPTAAQYNSSYRSMAPAAPTGGPPTPPEKICWHCRTRTTPLWRRDPRIPGLLCNACGLYLSQRGKLRPRELIDAEFALNADGGGGTLDL